MTDQGPVIEALTRRLAECPRDFLEEPVLGGRGKIFVDAVVSDLVMDLGGSPLSRQGAENFKSGDKKQRNRLRLVLVAAWLLHDDAFREAGVYAKPAYEFLRSGLKELAGVVSADLFVTDPDRREELARLCLEALDLLPGGETKAQAADRLKTLGSVERQKVIEETRAAEKRARELRAAMEKKRAEEAAAKATHE
jgi:hypothetical protein